MLLTCAPDKQQCVPEACDIREAMAEAADAVQNKIAQAGQVGSDKPGTGKELAPASEVYVRD